MNNITPIDASKIQLVGIKTIQGNIDGNAEVDANLITGHLFDFELGTGIRLPDNLIGFQLVVRITAHDQNGQPLDIKGSYTHEILFVVDNLAEWVQQDEQDEKQFQIEGTLGSTLISIAYSTVRGIIFTRTQGTLLGSVVLPVIDPRNLMS